MSDMSVKLMFLQNVNYKTAYLLIISEPKKKEKSVNQIELLVVV